MKNVLCIECRVRTWQMSHSGAAMPPVIQIIIKRLSKIDNIIDGKTNIAALVTLAYD